jgi:hypothetical protein
MRCATLIDAWTEAGYGTATVIGKIDIPFVRRRIDATGAALNHVPANPSILVVDSYDADVRTTPVAGTDGALRVVVDDLGGAVDGYDVVLNPNAYPANHLYPHFRGATISGKTLIRPGLPRWHGAGDGFGVSLGGGAPNSWLVPSLRRWAEGLANSPVTAAGSWVPDDWAVVRPEEAWSTFAKCGMLLTAAGSTLWEAANVGIPVCVLKTAPNQELIAGWAAAENVTVIDATRPIAPDLLRDSLPPRVGSAKTLPYVQSGAHEIAATLYGMIS